MQTSAFFHASNETKLMIIACIVGVAFRVTHTTLSSAGLCQFGISCKKKHTQTAQHCLRHSARNFLASKRTLQVYRCLDCCNMDCGKDSWCFEVYLVSMPKKYNFFLANCYANYWFFCSAGLFIFYATILKQTEKF